MKTKFNTSRPTKRTAKASKVTMRDKTEIAFLKSTIKKLFKALRDSEKLNEILQEEIIKLENEIAYLESDIDSLENELDYISEDI